MPITTAREGFETLVKELGYRPGDETDSEGGTPRSAGAAEGMNDSIWVGNGESDLIFRSYEFLAHSVSQQQLDDLAEWLAKVIPGDIDSKYLTSAPHTTAKLEVMT